MLPNGSPILMALVAAYCALASPINAQPDGLQGVRDTLKAQLEADNVTDASVVINEAEASLWANGVLNDDVLADLKQEIHTLATKGNFSADAIAKRCLDYLRAKGAFQKPDQDEAADKTIPMVLDTEAIKHLETLATKSNFSADAIAKGAFQKPDQDEAADETIVPGTKAWQEAWQEAWHRCRRNGGHPDICCAVM